MTTKHDSKTVTEVSSTDSQDRKPLISLRRERVKVLGGVRSGVRTGRFARECVFESIEW